MYFNVYGNSNNNNNMNMNNNNNNMNKMKPDMAQMNSYIRLLHAAPNAPAVDIYANDTALVNELEYMEYTDYLPIPSGNYTIKVYPSGVTDTPVIDTDLFLPPNTIVTIAAIGTLPELSLYPIQEPTYGQHSGDSCVRVVHLSPDAPNVDVKLEDGTVLFGNVSYKNISNYICMPAGTYSFNVTVSGTENEVLTVPDINLEADSFYTIYITGLAEKAPALKALLLNEPRY